MTTISEIGLSQPHSYLRRLSNKTQPKWTPKDCAIWTSTALDTPNPGCTSVTLDTDGSGLYIKANVQNIADGTGWYIRGTVTAEPSVSFQTPLTFTPPAGATTFLATMVLGQGVVQSAPWTVNGTVDWKLHTCNPDQSNDVSTDILTTQLQLYGVTPDLAPFYKDEGIPVELLDFFTPPSWIFTRADWVTFAVRRAHASTFDPDVQSIAKHHFRYDNYSGSSRYSPNGGGGFNVDLWFNRLKESSADPKKEFMLNCYDQSGLVQTALHLAFPFHYRRQDQTIVVDDKGNKLTNIGKVYKDPFGFINTVDLVGWGDCNSPFFGGGKTAQIVDTSDTTGYLSRESFTTHAWVFIRKPYEELQNGDVTGIEAFHCVDACALFHGGASPVPLSAYLANVIDLSTTVASNDEKFKKYHAPLDSQAALNAFDTYNGVRTLQAIATRPTAGIASTFSSRKQSGTFKNLTDFANEGQSGEDLKMYPVVIADLVAHVHNTVRPNDPQPTLTSQDVGSDGSKAVYDFYSAPGDSESSHTTFSITVLDSTETATQAGILDASLVSSGVNEDDRLGLVHWSSEKGYYQLFILGNLFVRVDGWDSFKIASAANDFIKNNYNADLCALPASSIQVIAPGNAAFSEEFDITVQARSLGPVDIHCEKGKIRDMQTFRTSFSGNGTDASTEDSWKVSCTTRTTDSVSDQVIIYVAEARTLLTTTVTRTIQLN